MQNPKAIIIGAGMAGLSAALELNRQGVEVLVLEKAATPGGKIREVRVDGLPIDSGPTVFTMRWVFDQLFEAAGSRLDEHLRLVPLDILARHAWSEHERLDLFADPERSADAIGAFAGPEEARRFQGFCQQARRTYHTLEDTFIHNTRPTPVSLVARAGLRRIGDLMRMSPYDTLWHALGKHFHDPRLRQLFGRYSTYCGSSPYLAPATLMLIAHVEQQGVWSVEDGMARLPEALYRLAAAQGVQFLFETRVTRINLRAGRVCGVAIGDHETLDADLVVFNGDANALARGHLGIEVAGGVKGNPPAARSLSALTWSLMGIPRGFPLTRHNVFFSKDYAAEFRDIFEHRRLPGEPTVYICAQDRTDDGGHEPDGPERLFCLVNAPPCGDQHHFKPAEITQCEESTFRLLARCGLHLDPTQSPHHITTPTDFEHLFPATGGALYGQATHGWRASFDRPGSHSRIPGLYLAGGSVHPGAGIPMATLSGRLAAQAVIQDLTSRKS
ncbi:1-hydroxycarotenoid 3,4-desaturase CrtD [Ectothiorhodospira magna]|uniref:1-hydroxycarotenoid 3,4-desaturase CrtD n=1 Tax=Ectothiorhodospira magna TaxID=867345 RepID=UPI000B7D225F|nr:1-hydroxycarotenoid 3,4-desaturase CrtD [Ectothiorhodospira magna]